MQSRFLVLLIVIDEETEGLIFGGLTELVVGQLCPTIKIKIQLVKALDKLKSTVR